ncbi:hypothetical protein NHJ6243_004805 [Beauveria neobassiana]
MTRVRNRTRTDGIPSREYQGRPPCPKTHLNNIVYLPDGTKYSADVAFGGDGSTAPLCMNEAATVHDNLGSQQVRLVHDPIDKQQHSEPRRRFTSTVTAWKWNSLVLQLSGARVLPGGF